MTELFEFERACGGEFDCKGLLKKSASIKDIIGGVEARFEGMIVLGFDAKVFGWI